MMRSGVSICRNPKLANDFYRLRLIEVILAYLSTKELIARQEVEQITGTSSSSAARVLKRMVQNGVLIRIGEGKNTRYMLAKT